MTTLVFKRSRISQFSPFLAFVRPLWPRIHARTPGCDRHGSREETPGFSWLIAKNKPKKIRANARKTTTTKTESTPKKTQKHQ